MGNFGGKLISYNQHKQASEFKNTLYYQLKSKSKSAKMS